MTPASRPRSSMLFNSWQFLCLTAVVFPLYYRLSISGQNWMLLIASYVFYGAWDVRFLLLLMASTVVDYAIGLRLGTEQNERRRRHLIILSLIGNLGVLGFFKYFGFFVSSASAALEALGVPAWRIRLDIVLPVGISFYTFQSLSYTIDIYRRQIEPTRSLRDFALFVAYFPQLVAGPIERARHLLPQIIGQRSLTLAGFRHGMWLVSWGFFKKVVIADNLAIVVDRTFAAGSGASGAEYLVAVYAFAYQIYCDFSGYSDIARGLAAMMGIDLMLNFRRPYLATDPRDFWRRWHISLSTWLRDYLYIPLGGNRGGPLSTYRALLLTMIIGGLWHGAAWTFVAWGAFHGAWLAVHRHLTVTLGWQLPDSRMGRTVGRVLTFHAVCIGWLLFRAEDMTQVWSIIVTSLNTPLVGSLAVKGLGAMALVIGLLALVERTDEEQAPVDGWSRHFLMAGLWFGSILLPPAGGNAFIYFQF